MKAPWKFLRHTYYKELCAAASIGDLPLPERERLNLHLKSCAGCREIYRDYAGINAALLPETSDDEEIIARLEASTRGSVLESVAVYGQQDTTPLLPAAPARTDSQSWLETLVNGQRRTRAWSAALVMVAVLCFALGDRYESLRFNRTRAGNVATSPGAQRSDPHSGPAPNPMESIQLQLDQAERNRAQLREALQSEQQHDALLEASLADRDRQLLTARAGIATLQEQVAAREQDLANIRAALASKSAELQQVETSANSNQATVIELRYKIQELTERASLEAADLQRERDLLSKGREIRDIVGARNLHIVDVYDAGAKGHTQRPFARAFYTEGKSLVFYAYDLPAQQSETQLSYVAWGQKNGKKSSIRNLGMLVNDDQGQRRWSLNFSDPHVLAEIDSVFITVEPTADANQPSGKRMLTAYLNDAVNHP